MPEWRQPCPLYLKRGAQPSLQRSGRAAMASSFSQLVAQASPLVQACKRRRTRTSAQQPSSVTQCLKRAAAEAGHVLQFEPYGPSGPGAGAGWTEDVERLLMPPPPPRAAAAAKTRTDQPRSRRQAGPWTSPAAPRRENAAAASRSGLHSGAASTSSLLALSRSVGHTTSPAPASAPDPTPVSAPAPAPSPSVDTATAADTSVAPALRVLPHKKAKPEPEPEAAPADSAAQDGAAQSLKRARTVPVEREMNAAEAQWIGAFSNAARAPHWLRFKEEDGEGGSARGPGQEEGPGAAVMPSILRLRAFAAPARSGARRGGGVPRGRKAVGAVVRRRVGRGVLQGAMAPPNEVTTFVCAPSLTHTRMRTHALCGTRARARVQPGGQALRAAVRQRAGGGCVP